MVAPTWSDYKVDTNDEDRISNNGTARHVSNWMVSRGRSAAASLISQILFLGVPVDA